MGTFVESGRGSKINDIEEIIIPIIKKQRKEIKVNPMWKKTEAQRISFSEAVLILISIAFGVSYISVMENNGNPLMFIMLFYNFIFGIVSCYMLT